MIIYEKLAKSNLNNDEAMIQDFDLKKKKLALILLNDDGK